MLAAGAVATALAAAAAYAWPRLGEQSALTTSYSSLVAHRQTRALDAYELVSGVQFFRRTAGRLTAGKSGDREALEALMDWTHENVRPQYAAPGRLVSDTFLDIVRRGWGYCDQSAHVFATLAHFAGYDARLLFLRRADGVSPHTVAEVRVDGRWVVVDPWLGVMLVDRAGNLAGVADLGESAQLSAGYAILGGRIDEDAFRRGTPSVTFPYQPTTEFLPKVWDRFVGAAPVEKPVAIAPPVAPAPRTGPQAGLPPGTPSQPSRTEKRAAGTAQPGARRVPAMDKLTLDSAILRMDRARRAHLDGRYDQAIAGYRTVLDGPLPPDMAESARFFLGMALLRAGSPREAIDAFDQALEAVPDTAWHPSLLFYRAEARLRGGDVEGAVRDLRAAGIPPARAMLAGLERK
jgi:hypothetical protein